VENAHLENGVERAARRVGEVGPVDAPDLVPVVAVDAVGFLDVHGAAGGVIAERLLLGDGERAERERQEGYWGQHGGRGECREEMEDGWLPLGLELAMTPAEVGGWPSRRACHVVNEV
jgi:hypothetical protein